MYLKKISDRLKKGFTKMVSKRFDEFLKNSIDDGQAIEISKKGEYFALEHNGNVVLSRAQMSFDSPYENSADTGKLSIVGNCLDI